MEIKPDEIRKIFSTKLNCGKNLLELTTYDNISMWWMVHSLFIGEVFTKGDSSLRKRLMVCTYKSFGPFIQIINDFILASIVKSMIFIFDGPKKSKIGQIAFLTQNLGWRSSRDVKTGIDKKIDVNFNTVIDTLTRRGYGVNSFYPVSISPIEGMKILCDKLKKWEVSHKPTDAYLHSNVVKEYVSATKYFKNVWKILCEDKTFNDICAQFGKDIQGKIITNMEFYFIFLFPFLVRESKLFENMIKNEKPSAIVMINEYSWLERAYLAKARAEGVPVIALQHGIIHPTHPGYRYYSTEISDCVNSPFCPIPDKTAVSGNYYFDILTKMSSYPESNVVVTGQPRYDVLYQPSKIYKKEIICEKYKIVPTQRIVLWTTQSHGLSDEENYKNMDCIFNTFKNFKNTTLIIKQHPKEPNKYEIRYRESIKAYNNIVLVPKESDTLELISICDLLITKSSTTAIEAAALNKPIVILELDDAKDSAGYVRDGIAIGAYSDDDLGAAILHLFANRSMLSGAQKEYMEKHLYKIDGKSSQRVADLIINTMPRAVHEQSRERSRG